MAGRVYKPYVLTEEKKKFAEDNIGLMYNFLRNNCGYGKSIVKEEEDEILGLLHEKMCNTVHLFDDTREATFSTYSYKSFSFALARYFNLKSRYTKRYVTVDFSSSGDGDNGDDVDRRSIIPTTKNKKDLSILWRNLKEIIDVSDLKPFEREVIEMYFDQGMTMGVIGKKKGFTGERIRQIKKNAIQKMNSYVMEARIQLEDFYI